MGVLSWSLKPDRSDPPPIRRISMDLGVEGNLHLVRGTAARLSPDGSTLAYIFFPEGGVGRHKLYLRRLDQLEPTELTAAEGANPFCFSPDGQWIAFYHYGTRTIKKVSITGGAAITLCKDVLNLGIDWSDDGWIIFAPSLTSGLARVSSSGGSPEPVTTLSEEERTHGWPQVLPGGQAVLYTARGLSGGYDDANIMVQRFAEGGPEIVWQGGYHARYLSSGHLVYIHQGTLFAAAFDLESLTLKGQPSPMLEEVATNENGGAHFDVSADGTLVYVRGSVSERLFELEWVDRKGGRELLMPADDYRSFKLSPDGRFLAYSLDDGEQADIWIYDIERGVPTKLTFDPSDDNYPIWSPSGESIVFRSNRDGNQRLYWKRTDGSGEAQRLTDSENVQTPWSWHPEGRHLAILEVTPEGLWDVRILELAGDDRTGWTAMETTDFQATRFLEVSASFSPDGLWLAYASDESEQYQVFVRSFPGGGGKKQISIEGLGSGWPTWSPTNQELLFYTAETPGSREMQIFTVKYRIDEGVFIPDRPVRWEGGTAFEVIYRTTYDLHPDGERLLVRKLVEEEDTEQT
ncbi:MAG: PD40 domain-containing protein [Planctomycetes bacterium]|nr:PD40 domain-containing protein [Planctomycetota bacterium]